MSGSIEVICGSMFSGKTEELIRRIRRAIIAKQKVAVFNHSIDNRYLSDHITSHNGLKHECVSAGKSSDILSRIPDNCSVIAIDEAQFFDNELVSVVHLLAHDGYRVIVAGLKTDFKGESFGPMGEIAASPVEELVCLSAICVVCGRPAHFTQRIIDGQPAAYGSPVILVGGKEAYEARCREHFVVPGHPISAFAKKDFLEASALLPALHDH